MEDKPSQTTIEQPGHRRCLALYSGGLDSIVSIKLLERQGVEVIPLFFATPFFGATALSDPDSFRQKQRELCGIDPQLVDYTDDFLTILANPRHGYGKHFNPCIDCKIGMLRTAKTLLEGMQASFVITGEVLGQRPMSQRRDAMHIIERDTGLKDILLRPLCALHMHPTWPERTGLVDRTRLMGITGRGRKRQEQFARELGLTEIPTPAGGCLLTYEQIADKVRDTYARFAPGMPSRFDLELDTLGRKFMLDDHTVLVVGRSEQENDQLAMMERPGNVFLKTAAVPGPLCILRGDSNRTNLERAAGICLRYGKGHGLSGMTVSFGISPQIDDDSLPAPVMSDQEIKAYQVGIQTGDKD